MMLARPVPFPLHGIVNGACGCGHPGCTRIGKHPAALWRDLAYGDAVPKPEPGAGTGLKTGAHPKGSGVFVIDLDGEDAIGRWDDLDQGRASETFTVETGRGLQLYFEHPGFAVRNSVSDLAKGIDVRGEGGYVVAPGSPHRNGKTYAVLVDVAPAAAPTWLLDWLRARPAPAQVEAYEGDVEGDERERRIQIFRDYLATAPPSIQGEGGDVQLFSVVQRGAYDLALPVDDVLAAVRDVYDPRCVPPWGSELEERVRYKARSAKTHSTRPAMPPLPADLAHLATGAAAPARNAPAAAVTSIAASPPTPIVHRLSPADRARKVGGKGVRLATGFRTVDNACRGGFLMRKVAVVGGAPGAGKTAFTVQLAHTWVTQGVPVGFLAADEDAEGILIRFGQLAGLSRDALEKGDPIERERLADWCSGVPLMLGDCDEGDTIESFSKDIRRSAGDIESVLVVDSIQTGRSSVPMVSGSDIRARVNQNIVALKHAAKVDNHFVIATSEISKAAYRNKEQADNINMLSAFKESGDIEYGVSFAMVLVSRQGAPDLVDAVVAKNRLGHGRPELLLKLDPERAGVMETSATDAASLDPLYLVKADIRSTLEERVGAPMTKTQIYSKLGGRKERVVQAINEMLGAGELFQDPRGVRPLMPGDPGWSPRNSLFPPS